MPSRKKDFPPEIANKILLWCARHCCLCGKVRGPGIEVAHIDPNGGRTIDNALPLCFDCHERTFCYDPEHPRGRRYRPAELKARREQIYEQFTSHLVPLLSYGLTQDGRDLPDVGFWIKHLGGPHWVKVRVWVALAQGTKVYGYVHKSKHYDGTYVWNLNPGFGVSGHFPLPLRMKTSLSAKNERIRARIDVCVIDIYERHHTLLPVGYVLPSVNEDWYLEPSEEVLKIAAPRIKSQ